MSSDNARIERMLIALLAFGLCVLAFALGIAAVLLMASPVGAIARQEFNRLLGLDSVQVFWYMTRAAGLTAYMLIWLSTVWGIAVSSKIFDPWMSRVFTYDFHQFLSILAIGFLVLHIGVLMFDHYMPYSLTEILVPFMSPYRPLWVGIGVLGFYLTILVSVTFYMKSTISPKNFRTIHYLSYLAFAGSALHGLFAGTDSPLITTQLMYVGTSLAVVFLTAYHVITKVSLARESRALVVSSKQ